MLFLLLCSARRGRPFVLALSPRRSRMLDPLWAPSQGVCNKGNCGMGILHVKILPALAFVWFCINMLVYDSLLSPFFSLNAIGLTRTCLLFSDIMTNVTERGTASANVRGRGTPPHGGSRRGRGSEIERGGRRGSPRTGAPHAISALATFQT